MFSYVCDEIEKYPGFKKYYPERDYPQLIKAIITRESSFNTFAISKDRCRGVMQISPQLIDDINKTRKEGYKFHYHAFYNWKICVKYGIWYYAKCYVKAKGDIINACTLYLMGINSNKKSSQYGKDILNYYNEFMK